MLRSRNLIQNLFVFPNLTINYWKKGEHIQLIIILKTVYE